MLGLLAWFAWLFAFGPAGWLGIAAAGLLLAYEHSIVSPRDLRRLNAAFFTMNGVIAMVFLVFVATDLWPVSYTHLLPEKRTIRALGQSERTAFAS